MFGTKDFNPDLNIRTNRVGDIKWIAMTNMRLEVVAQTKRDRLCS